MNEYIFKRSKKFDKLTLDWILSEATRLAKEGKTRYEIEQYLAKECDSSAKAISVILTQLGWKIRDYKKKTDSNEIIEFVKSLPKTMKKMEVTKKVAEKFGLTEKGAYTILYNHGILKDFDDGRMKQQKENKSEKQQKSRNEQIIKIPAKKKVKIIIEIE